MTRLPPGSTAMKASSLPCGAPAPTRSSTLAAMAWTPASGADWVPPPAQAQHRKFEAGHPNADRQHRDQG